MATAEQFFMVMQALQNMEGLRADVRRNAQAYQADVISGRLTLSQVQAVAREDAVQYLRRLKWMADIFADLNRRTRLIAGMTAVGITETEMKASHDEIRAVAVPLTTVTWADAAAVTTTVNQILAAVPAHDRVF